jgi:hypothetical protein
MVIEELTGFEVLNFELDHGANYSSLVSCTLHVMGKLKQVASVVRVAQTDSLVSTHVVSDQEGDVANGQLDDLNASLTGENLYALQIRRSEQLLINTKKISVEIHGLLLQTDESHPGLY